MTHRLLLLCLVLLVTGCSQNPARDGDGKLYSYVDAQGNLVTVQKPAGEAEPKEEPEGQQMQPEAGAQESRDQKMPGGSAGAGVPADEPWQTPEEVEKKLEEQERDRFVSYVGPEGEVINRPLDLVAEREALERRPAPFEEVDGTGEYIETVSRIPADCCAHTLEQASKLEAGAEQQLGFAPGETTWIRLDQPRPARVLALTAKTGRLELRSFIHDDAYLSPRLLLLDEKGIPVLKVDNIFTRRYPENWHRFGYFQGELPLSAGHAYVVVFLPYGRWDDGRVLDDGSLDGVSEGGARAALRGELVVRARAGKRETPGGEPSAADAAQ